MSQEERTELLQDLSDARNNLEQMEKTPHLFTLEIEGIKARIRHLEQLIAIS